jgi:hypothetical protein
VPGLAVLGVDVGAVVSLGTKPKQPTVRNLAHRQNVLGFFWKNVDRNEINFVLAVRSEFPAHVTLHAYGIQAILHIYDGLYLHPPQVLPSLHDEVKRMVCAIRLSYHETEFHRLVQKRHFTKIPVPATRKPASPGSLPGTALLGRWSASA